MFSNHLQSKQRNRRRIMYIGFVLAIFCAFAAVGSGVGYRLGLWHFSIGFQILKWSVFLSFEGRTEPDGSRFHFCILILVLVLILVFFDFCI